MRTLHTLTGTDLEVGETGTTVRRGLKWSDFSKGDEIDICRCNREAGEHNIVAHGRIDSIQLYRFRDIPSKVFSQQHYRNSRSYDTTLEAIRRAYPDFDENEIVTVLYYERTQ